MSGPFNERLCLPTYSQQAVVLTVVVMVVVPACPGWTVRDQDNL